MSFDFTGKKILVTGAGRGISRALVKALVEAGGEVVYALSLTKENLDSLVEELPGVHPIQVDLSDWEDTRREVDKIEPLECLVNNAGIYMPSVPSLEVDKDTIEKVCNVNMMAAINITQSVAKKMVKAGKGGSIVNNSSVCGRAARANKLAYTVSKASLDMVSKQFAVKLGFYNIRVNSINRTVISGNMARSVLDNPERLQHLRTCTPLRRYEEVRECVELIMFLLSEHSTMITGTLSRIDGGLLSHIRV